MLTYKRKGEKEQTIDETLAQLTEILRQEKAEVAFWELLQKIEIVKTDVLQLESREYFEQLVANQWDWVQLEQLADLWSNINDEANRETLRVKARELLEFIQKESKSFSFEIAQKIQQLKQ